MKSLVALFVRNPVFVNILLAMILISGAISALMMLRETMPQFAIDQIVVRVPYPGAGPEEAEEGIALKLEDALEGVEGIRRLTTISSENYAQAVIDVHERADMRKVKDEVTNRVGAIMTFPVDAERPIITETLLRNQVLLLAVYGDLPERQLKEIGEQVREELAALPEISQVTLSGARDYEISIEVSEERLRQQGLTFDQVSQAVRQASLNFPAGEVRDEDEEIKIRLMGRRYTGAEYAEIILRAGAGGSSTRLGDVATIRDDFTESETLNRFKGRPAMLVNIYRTSDEDALAIAAAARAYIERKQAELPPGVGLHAWADSSRFITERLDLLLRNGRVGLLLVFLLLWLFLDLRLAFWVSLGIPISLAGALALMGATGQTINMLSLFALIMILGIIVDDAIVVGEAIYVARRRGLGPVEAAIAGTSEVGWPVFAAVTTTIVAFAPLLFVSGIMGKFIRVLPFAVICALAISLAEGLLMLPAHLRDLPDPNPDPHAGGPLRRRAVRLRRALTGSLEWFVDRVYRPFMRFDLEWRYVTLSISLAILLATVGLWQGGFVKFQLFPEVDTDYVFATVEFPAGTPPETTRVAVERMEARLHEVTGSLKTLSGEPPIQSLYTSVGYATQESVSRGQIILELLPTERRGVHFRKLIADWEKAIGPIPGAVSLNFRGAEAGPGGAPIEAWLLSDDMDQLRAAADEIKRKLQGYDGVFQIEDDFRAGKRELRARLKPEAHNLGLTAGALGRQLRQGFYGDEALRIQRGRDEVRVWVRYPRDQRRSPADLEAIRIRTPGGAEVPLATVADVSLEQGYATIRRANGQRRLRVTADVDDTRANSAEVMADLKSQVFPDLVRRHPGLKIEVEGQSADTAESLNSLKIGFPLGLLGIFLILATMFRSYIQPLVIMVTIPFGLVGAVVGHMVMGFDITMLSMFGLVALTGIVVNDAIVLIEAVNHRVMEGMPLKTALVEAGARRFRAIILTTLTTFFGLAPLLFETSMQAMFLIPMAISIAFGVLASTFWTLVLIPCLLLILSDLRLALYWLRHGRLPATRNTLEPAAIRNGTPQPTAEPAPAELALVDGSGR